MTERLIGGMEFRVRYRREGRASGASLIYQTEKAARAKIDRLLALEEVKGDSRFSDMPDLAGTPTLEVREVGVWLSHPDPPPPVPSSGAVEAMRGWVAPDDPGGWGPF